jgi:hypothetical protein
MLVVHGGCGRAGLVADFAESFGFAGALHVAAPASMWAWRCAIRMRTSFASTGL